MVIHSFFAVREPTTPSLPIVQFWHSPSPPLYIAEAMQSFGRLNPERPHLVFDAQSAERFVSEHFGSRELAAFQACGPAAMQADYLRYCAIFQFGGIWADASFTCVKNLTPLLKSPFDAELFRAFSPMFLLSNNLFAFSSPRHPFLRLVLDLVTELIEQRWDGTVWHTSGLAPTGIYKLYQAGSLQAALQAPEVRADPKTSRYAHLVCEVVRDYDLLVKACKRIRVSSAERKRLWVGDRDPNLPHRSRERHHSSAGTDIYADSSRATDSSNRI